jgi:hypothetical protein
MCLNAVGVEADNFGGFPKLTGEFDALRR